jgi:hypothetical protein
MTTTNTTLQAVPNGPAWAAILAAGIGCAVFGLVVDLAEASKATSNALNFYKPAGDLSGKTIVAIVVWIIAWAVLHARWKNRKLRSPGRIIALTLILILLALIAVFPPFFELFAAE